MSFSCGSQPSSRLVLALGYRLCGRSVVQKKISLRLGRTDRSTSSILWMQRAACRATPSALGPERRQRRGSHVREGDGEGVGPLSDGVRLVARGEREEEAEEYVDRIVL